MANKVYGQLVVANTVLEKFKKIFAEEAEAFEVLEEHTATYEDVVDVSNMHSLARYAADRGLYTTVIFSYNVEDYVLESQAEAMIL